MRSLSKHLALLTATLILFTGGLQAKIPQVLTYKGVAEDGSGNPLLGPLDLQIDIFAVSGGFCCASE